MSLITSRKTVAAAGTAEVLTSETYSGKVSLAITAETDNTGYIAVGGSEVVAALATRTGIPLAAGDTVTLDELPQEVFIDATVSGDGVTFLVRQ